MINKLLSSYDNIQIHINRLRIFYSEVETDKTESLMYTYQLSEEKHDYFYNNNNIIFMT